jgi:hypothetical protein
MARQRLWEFYYLLLAFSVVVWWALIILVPPVRHLFFRPEDSARYLAFLAPDLLVYGVLALLSYASLRFGKPSWRSILALQLQLGGAVYATLFTMGYALLTGSGLLGVLLMTPTAIIPIFALRERT